jgi:hypothetical protein
MLAILFPHMYEDDEYLLPPNCSEDVVMGGIETHSSSHGNESAVAGPGPSTLRSIGWQGRR